MNNKNDINNKNSEGLIDGVIIAEEEEKKLIHGDDPKKKRGIENIFNFPNLN